jgi:outer membrane protein
VNINIPLSNGFMFDARAKAADLQTEANSYDLAQSRYNLELSSIVEFSQATLQKTEADIESTDAEYQYRLTQIVLAFTMSSPK